MIPISDVVTRGLCCGCGTCAGVCPTQAIRMKASEGLFLPELSESLCNGCLLCSKSCPGGSVDFETFQRKIFGRAPELNSVGNYSNCFLGYSNNDKIRFNSSSGGVITQLLIFALENKLIDGAVVTRMRKDNPLEPESFIARTVEEILDASKSKYCPVETNACLNQILKEPGRYAVVGLPCHIHGVRKAETVLRPLEKRIVLRLGLLCSHTVDFAGLYFLLKKLRIRREEVNEISYRGGGWPGFLSIETRGRQKTRLPLVGSWKAYWPLFSSFFFTPMRCTMCPDQTAELADISFGDAWLPELKHEKSGTSIVISRTRIGQNLLDQATRAKSITLTPVGVEKVLQSQFTNLKFKKNDLNFRLSFLRSRGKDTPSFKLTPPPSSSSISASLRSTYIYSGIKASSNAHFRHLLQHVPFPLIRLYYGIYKSLCKI